MKRFGWLLLLLFFTGCTGKTEEIERGMALRSRLLSAESCSFDAEVTADYGDKIYAFTLSCVGNAKGDLTFEVKQPESIAGITGKIDNQGGKLTFDDTVLHFELLTDDQISPISAPSWFISMPLPLSAASRSPEASMAERGIQAGIPVPPQLELMKPMGISRPVERR